MKPRRGNSTAEWNPPLVIVARLAFLLFVACGLGSALLLLTGAMMRQPHDLELGFAGMAAATGLFAWLRRGGRLAEIVASIDGIGSPGAPEGDFAALVSAWDELQAKRGAAGFDAWELLRLRREIEARAKADPALAAYWRDHQT